MNVAAALTRDASRVNLFQSDKNKQTSFNFYFLIKKHHNLTILFLFNITKLIKKNQKYHEDCYL